MHYWIQPRDQIFVKGWVFFLFLKNISKNLSGKHSGKLLDHAKQSVKDALKTTSKELIQKNSRSNW